MNPKMLFIFRETGFLDNPEKRMLIQDWQIVRFTIMPYPNEPNLINSNLREKLPFDDNTFDAIYAYHIVEHLTIEETLFFLKELFRVLKVNGVCRISTPDLEFKAADYLKQLQHFSQNPNTDNHKKYTWATIALIDQLARTKSGGLMGDTYKKGYYEAEHLKKVHGDVLHYIFDPSFQAYLDTGWMKTYFDGRPAPLWFWIKKIFWAAVRKLLLKLTKTPLEWWQEREAWLYDRVSLDLLMKEAKFEQIATKTHDQSDLLNWEKYRFDTSAIGNYDFEPSVYVEGRKVDTV